MSGKNTNLLWSKLSNTYDKSGQPLYTKSYSDFVDQFSDTESRMQLHKALVDKNLYTRNSTDFVNQFFKDENSYKYIKSRKIKNQYDVLSSHQNIISTSKYGKNEELTGRVIMDFFGKDIQQLIKSKHAGTRKGIKLLNKHSSQTWINYFGGGEDGAEKYELFKKYIETREFDHNEIESVNLMSTFNNSVASVTNDYAMGAVGRYNRGIKNKHRDKGIYKKVELAAIEQQMELFATGEDFDINELVSNDEELKRFIEAQNNVLNNQYKILTNEGKSIENEIKNNTKIQNGETIWIGSESDRVKLFERTAAFNQSYDDFFDRADKFQANNLIIDMVGYNYNSGYEMNLNLKKAWWDMKGFVSGAANFATDFVGIDSDWLDKKREAHIDMQASLQQQIQTTVPPKVKFQDASWEDRAALFKQMLNNNIFSIGAVLKFGTISRMGRRWHKVKGGGPVVFKQNKFVINTARTGLLTTFFTSEGGAKLGEMEISQRNASSMLYGEGGEGGGLYDALEKEIDYNKRVDIQQQIDYYERAANFKEWEKAAAAILYGGIATIAEYFGTLRYFDDMRRIINLPGSPMRKLLQGTGRSLLNVVIEETEETLTQIGHNLTDILLLDEDKSMLDGLDQDFFANVAFSSLAIQGPSMMTTGYSVVTDVVKSNRSRSNLKNLQKEVIKVNTQIIELENQLKDPTVRNKKQIRTALKDARGELMGHVYLASTLDSYALSNAANMTNEELVDLFEQDRITRKLTKKARSIGATSVEGTWRTDKLKKIQQQLDKARQRKEEIIGTPKKRLADKLNKVAKETKVELTAEQHAAFGELQYWKNMAMGTGAPLVVVEGKGEDILGDARNQLDTYLQSKGYDKDSDTYKATMFGFENRAPGANIGGDVIIFEDNAMANIRDSKDAGSLRAAKMVALHELGHIYDKKMGVVKDNKVVKAAQDALSNIENDIKQMYESGRIKKAAYEYAKQRIDGYKKLNQGKIDLSELTPLIAELRADNLISSNSKSGLLSLTSLYNSVRRKILKKNAHRFEFKDTESFIDYVDNFVRKTRNQRLALALPPEKEDKKARLSLKMDAYSSSNRALVKILNTLNIPNADSAIKEEAADRAEFTKVWNAEWKGKDQALFVGKEVGPEWRSYAQNIMRSIFGEVPGYTRLEEDMLDVLTIGIERGENGIPFIVRSWDPSERRLTSHIEGLIRERIKGLAKLKKFADLGTISVSKDKPREEGRAPIDVPAAEGVEKTIEKKEKVKNDEKRLQEEQRFRKDVGITKTMVDDFKKEVADILKDPKLGAVTEFEFYQNFRNKIVKTKLFQKISAHIGTVKSTKFKQFLKDIAKDYVKNAPASDLVALERLNKKKIFTTFKHRATTKAMIKAAIDQGLLKSFEIKQDEQGPAMYEKQDVDVDSYVDFFYGKRGRRESLIKNIVNMIGMDAIFTVYRTNKDVQEALEVNNKNVKNLLGELKNKIDRGIDVKFSINMNSDQKTVLSKGLPKFTKQYFETGDVVGSFNATFPDNLLNLTDNKKNKLILDLKKLISKFETVDAAYRKIDKKAKFNFNNYLSEKLMLDDYLKNFKEAKGIPTDGANFGKMEQIIAAREGLIAIRDVFIERHGEKLGLEMFDTVFRGLSSQTQLGSTNTIMRTLTHVNRTTSAIQKKIDNILESYDKKIKIDPKAKLTEKQEKALLKYIQDENYKLRDTKGLVNNVKDYIKNFLKGKKINRKNYPKRLTAANIRKIKTLKEATSKYSEFKEAAKKEVDLFIETLDIITELENNPDIDFTSNETVMIMASLLDSTNSPLFAMSPFRFAFVDKKGNIYKGDFVYEHMITRSIIGMFALEYQKGNISKKEIKDLLSNTFVSNIPKMLDNLINNGGLKSNMSSMFDVKKLIAGKIEAILDRYVSAETMLAENKDGSRWGHIMKDLGLKLVDLETGKTIKHFENFNKASNAMNKGNVKFSIFNNARDASRVVRPSQGMSVWDFDDTIARSKSMVLYTSPDNIKGSLTAEQFASNGATLLEQGYKFDFSEFKKVVKGEKGPFFQKFVDRIKKFGVKDNFILTARPVESAPAIRAFLKSLGLNIPLKNIKALADSTASAKALWIADKIGNEGYNDVYFADDALQNVEAVKNMMEQFDIKSKVQQAKVKFSLNMDKEFNKILEEKKGVPINTQIDNVTAYKMGAKKGRFAFFLPPSNDDLTGMLYYFLGKGKQGEKHFEWFKKALINPLNRAYRELYSAKQAIANDFRALKKEFKDVNSLLNDKVEDTVFTYSDAIRVYLWDRAGFDIPGLSDVNKKMLIKEVKSYTALVNFANLLGEISRSKDGYIQPTENWKTEDIRDDMLNATNNVGRKQFFTEFLENVKVVFSEKNLNKIEALYGPNFRAALEDILYRIENGTNRNFGRNKIVNEFMNWVNGSIGATMFLNIRSATLQTISWVNFINWNDNNVFKAAAAMANRKQFWTDFTMIFNSDMLKQRRRGLQTDINAAELAGYVRKSRNPARAAVNWLLNKGFLPTQIMDSFAIALGGASMYRNRFNTYIKQGLSQKEAQEKAWVDFMEVAETTQQSAREDKISQQQASVLGRLILAFQNTPTQYMRLTKKAMLDLVNGRGDAKTHISKIIYYTAVQNFIFYALQSALFSLAFGEDEDEDFANKKKLRVINGMMDTILRGLGIAGAVVSTIKNMAIKFAEQDKKSYNKDEGALIIEALNLSPPIGIKARKLDQFQKTIQWNKEEIHDKSLLDLSNPIWKSTAYLIEATTNAPLARTYNKANNISEALDSQNATWQRIALFLGWNKWNLGIEDSYRPGPQPSSRRKRRKTTYY